MESNNDTPTDEGFKPPYNLAFRTLLNLWMRMEKEPPPPRIDRSYLKNMAGADQTATISALRGFGLIGEAPDNRVKPELLKLAQNSDDRPNMVAALLEKYYAKQIELSKQNATPAMLEESFNEYGYSVETRRKAVTFFLKAADYAGIPLSPHFKIPQQRSARSSRPRTPRPTSGNGSASQRENGGKEHEKPQVTTGVGKTVKLRSGGEVSLSYDADFFSLDTRDRDFILSLIDALRAYEDRKSLPQGEEEG